MYSTAGRKVLPALVAALTLVLGSLGTGTAWADDSFLGIISLVDDPQIKQQLNLTDEVAAKLKQLADERDSAAIGFTLSIKDLPPEERTAKMAEFRQESERLGLALLTPEQQTILRQAQVSKAGVQALADETVIEQLGLSAEQREKITALLEEYQRATSQGSEAQRRFARSRLERELMEQLTQEQKATWDKLTGRLPGPADGADAVASNDTPDSTEPAPPAPPSGRGGFRSPVSGEFGGPGGPGGFGRRSSDSGRSERGGTDRGNTGSTEGSNESTSSTSPSGEKLLKFNFRFAPWKDVLEWFADHADLSLVMDAPPQGTFNYSDSRAYTPAQAIDLLNGVLLTKGYTLVRRERMLMVVNLEDGVPPELVPRIEMAELDKKGEFELVQVQFQLSKMTAEEAEPEIRKLLGPQGSVVVLSKARQVVVTETAGKLRTIRAMIEAVENPQIPKDEKVSVVTLQYVTPTEFLIVARQLLGMPENVNATPDGTLRLAVDELGNRVLATGKAERLERLEEIVKLVDVAGPGAQATGGPIEQPQLEVYTVSGADPTSVLQIMQTLLAGLPDVRLTTDPKTGNLVALAKPSQHATIRATLDQLQRDASKIEVIKLRRMDPQAAVLAINKLFGSADGAAAANGPRIDADPITMQLMIRGSASQVEQIREFLEKKGELGDDDVSEDFVRSKVRTIPLSGRSADSALEQIQQLWPTLHRNKIRIVRPSQSQTGIRTRGVPPLNEEPEDDLSEALRDPRLDPAMRGMLEDLSRPLYDGSPVRPARPAERPAPSTNEVPADTQRAPATDAPGTDKATRSNLGTSGRFHFVAQLSGNQSQSRSGENAAAPSANAPAPSSRSANANQLGPTDPIDDGEPEEVESVPGADIVVTVGPGGIVIASEDLDALDEFEQLLQSVAETSITSGREYTVFYLKYARAEVAATLLQEAIGGGMPSDDEGGGSLMGDIASSMMGDAGGLLGGLLGLGGGGGGGGASSASSSSSGVSIIPDPRLNALMVLARAKDIDMIEQLLQVIDQPSSPENVQTVAPPRFIPVLNSDAEQIAGVVRQVFASRLAADASQPRQPSPEDLIRALRGGGRGGRGGGGGQNNRGEEQKMTIGVDARSNSLIVSAPDYLFQEVKTLVEELDSAVLSSDETVRVVTLKRANTDVVQRSLQSVFGESVTSNRTSPSSSSSNNRSSSSRSSSGSSSRGSSNSMRQQIEMIQNMQRSMGGGGRGGFGGGGFGGGGRGGSRGR